MVAYKQIFNIKLIYKRKITTLETIWLRENFELQYLKPFKWMEKDDLLLI